MCIKVGKYILDKEQEKIVYDNSKYLLVTAGAGSGKTLTILGKIKYLIEYKNIRKEEILCISFTNKASLSLKEKIKKELNINIDVYTFHKLGLEILNNKYLIADSNLLLDIIFKFFYETIYTNKKLIILVLKYFHKPTNNYLKSYNRLIKEENKLLLSLINSIHTFIKLFKANNKSINDYKIMFKKVKHTINYYKYKKETIFLLISLNIYLIYEEYLKENKEIDFDDMLIKSMLDVKENGYKKSLKYIIIDEYQDTSFTRFSLIKEILIKKDASLLVVGDDFQSIYRFTGCNLDLFLNFKDYFPNANILKIQNTYRNSNELINVAGNFIMKNKRQITKILKANKSISKPIVIVYYKDLKKTINNLLTKIDKNYMILGRNNKDIELLPNNLKEKFLTVHRSKGLESDNVIIINLIDDILGFPNKIKNEKIFRLIINDNDKYPYSEERRLFYVALTRTKNKVYLLTKRKNKSIFVKELINNYFKYIEIIN